MMMSDSAPPPSQNRSGRSGTVLRRQEKMSEVIARAIVHDIVHRRLQSGAKLPAEAEMLEQFEVGRPTLREALRILEVQGLIQIRPGPGGGPIVAQANSRDFGRMSTLYYQMTGATFQELVEARLAMEPLMARLAAERRDPAQVDRLMVAISRAEGATVEDDTSWAAASTDFHGTVAGLSGNRVLDLFGESLKDVWLDRIVGLMYPTEARQQVRRDHEAIARAIEKGDARRAERLMREHMEEFLSFVAKRHAGLREEVIDWR